MKNMKIRVLLFSLSLLAMTWPTGATLLPTSSATGKASISQAIDITSVTQESLPLSPSHEIEQGNELLQLSPMRPPLLNQVSLIETLQATTQLKIDLDNFDMEYVLQIQ